MESPVVLVTGTSSGIGREAVLHLQEAGCTVFATARREEDLAGLEARGVATARLDVTDARRCEAVVGDIMDLHGRIDALVNNAGFGASLPVEETPEDVLQEMLDVNLVAPHRLARLVLPSMRERGRGRIVNVSSIAGHVAVPMIGAYCATKFALRALSQALHIEVRPFGVHVALIEPGRIRTRFSERARRERAQAAPGEDSPYQTIHDRWHAKDDVGGAHPRITARHIVHACTARRPRFRYLAPWDARLAYAARRLLPDRAVNAVLARYFRP